MFCWPNLVTILDKFIQLSLGVAYFMAALVGQSVPGDGKNPAFKRAAPRIKLVVTGNNPLENLRGQVFGFFTAGGAVRKVIIDARKKSIVEAAKKLGGQRC